MKIIKRSIFPFQEKEFFSPIRDKIKYAKIIALSARQLLYNADAKDSTVNANMKLLVDKMSRLFFYKNQKYFSISFPFTILTKDNDVLEIATYSGKKLDNKSISAIISILDSEQFKLNPSLIDFFIEPGSIESSGLFILEEIFQFEPSYIRYDFAPENENGKLHPTNHIDINFSQYSTFKLGLLKSISQAYFENLQNTNTDCLFISD